MSEQEAESSQTPEAQNQRLRDLVVWLSAALLRSMARDAPKSHREGSSIDAALLLLEAEECFRCARIPSIKNEIAEGLEATGHELMAKAVEIETVRQREKWKKSES
jgi:hypothetical protein